MSKNFTSNILVEKSGQHALNQGLRILGCAELYKFSIKKENSDYLPGFLLNSILSQGDLQEEKNDIAVYFGVGGERGVARKTQDADNVACVGRISETIFDINQSDINRLKKDVMQWCQNDSGQPKVLCLDLTITKPNDELVAWMQSSDIQKLITDNKLDILVWQSEQKQHSLGTGKFSAGSVYLISGDDNKVNLFNAEAIKSHQLTPDNNLLSNT